MKKMIFSLLIFLFCSCATPTTRDRNSLARDFERDKLSTYSMPKKGLWTKAVNTPRHTGKIHWYDKINPVWWFGNIDDPIPPDEYRPRSKCRKLTFALRNPFHNFTFYVIGIADRRFVKYGKYTEDVFDPHEGWNVVASRCGPFWLPFISYKRDHFKFYIGWRPNGNFGMKLNPKGDS